MNCDFPKLREKIREYMSEKRYLHTLGVESSARLIARHCMPDRLDEIAVAALLHDIAKELPADIQREYALLSGFSLSEDDLSTLPALHSFAAPHIIKCDFSGLATDDILSATFNHTVGSPDMSVFDEIIFVSDYVEENREYSHCKKMREFLFGNLRQDKSYTENLKVLHQALVEIIDFTIAFLNQRNMQVNERTKLTKNAFTDLI